jgi:NADP-dependent 3-hydroxy acid dehydrogenase YdfG
MLGARRTDRLNAIAAEITASGGKAKAFTADVTKKADVEALIASSLTAFGGLDVIVNNAGLMAIAPLSEGRTDGRTDGRTNGTA